MDERSKKSLTFVISMIWREQQNHLNGYFCKVNVSGMSKKSKHTLQYPNLPLARRPVPHCDEIPIPTFTSFATSSDGDSCVDTNADSNDEDFVVSGDKSSSCKPFTQAELNDLVRDLDLPMASAELLGSRLKERNMLAPGTTFMYRGREKDLLKYLQTDEELVYCTDAKGPWDVRT